MLFYKYWRNRRKPKDREADSKDRKEDPKDKSKENPQSSNRDLEMNPTNYNTVTSSTGNGIAT